MSGAFNIDVEVAKIESEKEKGQKIKIHCASLTHIWDIERSHIELKQFHKTLTNDDTITKNKINLGKVPSIENIDGCELYLSRLGCTAAVLRIKKFHEFLDIPEEVRQGLTFASHKPFGKEIKKGFMFRHSRFIRRGGEKRWIKLTKEERGGSVICYKDEKNKNSIISSLKLGAATQMSLLEDKGLKDSFVIKSGKRQWILQAVSSREFQLWQAKLLDILKQFGNQKMLEPPTEPEPEPVTEEEKETESVKSGGSRKSSRSPRLGSVRSAMGKLTPRSPKQQQVDQHTAKLIRENADLERKIKQMKAQMEEIRVEILEYQDKEIELRNLEREIRRKEQKNFERQQEQVKQKYEVELDEKRAVVEECHQKLEQKTYNEGNRSGLKALFGEEFRAVNIAQLDKGDVDEFGNFIDEDDSSSGEESSSEEEAGAFGALGAIGSGIDLLGDKDDDDDADTDTEDEDAKEETKEEESGDSQEKKVLNQKEEKEKEDDSFGDFKYIHKHLHRHDHKHIHDHRHVHIHDETGQEPVTYIQTQTIVHTITHTNTQFKIKMKGFL